MFKRRLSEFDPIEALAGRIPRPAVQLVFGVTCFGAALLVRAVIDLFTPGAGPFSLIYPAIMISTLYGRWQSGLVTFCLAYLHAWYFVLPFPSSFTFENSGDLARTVVNGSAALTILFLAEVFRAAVWRASRDRARELETQTYLMRELEHRTKNNFAMVSSLLSMQQRRSGSDEAKEALMIAAGRVQSFAAIHETIYSAQKYSAEIELRHYLEPLVRQLERGLFDGHRVRIVLDCDMVSVPRDRAVAIALIVNELVTNAAKHAFPGGREGIVTVRYRVGATGPWCLTVQDNGCGHFDGTASEEKGGSGLGKVLLANFAAMAGGEVVVDDIGIGTSVSVVEIVEDSADEGAAVHTASGAMAGP